MGNEHFSVDDNYLQQKVTEITKVTNELGSMGQQVQNEFSDAAGGMSGSEVHDALLTFQDSWLPMLQKLHGSCAEIAKDLDLALNAYIKTENANASRLGGFSESQQG